MENQIFEYDIIVEQGATFNLPIEVVDIVNGVETPTDLTGWTAAMQARETYNSEEYLFELTTENGGISVGGTSGQLNPTISGTASSAFPGGWSGVYDLKIYLPSGEIDRVIQGRVRIAPAVTK